MSLVRRVSAALLLLSAMAFSQAKDAKDYSKESFVIERSYTHISIAEDGSAEKHVELAFRVTSQAGLQALGIWRIPYAKAYSTVDVDYLRVRKPDGKVTETSLDSVDDMPAEITRQAPEYSDVREKHYPIKGLAVGDVLEISYAIHEKPMAAGQQWAEYELVHGAVAKSVIVEIETPVSKPLKVRSPKLQPIVVEKNGHKIYTWKYDVPAVKKEAAEPIPDASDVIVSTFRSWDEIGKWWSSLATDSSVVAPEVATKARVLTADAKSQQEKARILYDWVSSHIRYIGVSFGIGRFQPHPALDVFQNGYGDCKDKYTLLAAMLRSQGITSYPALVNAEKMIDPEVPSPSQFNHVVNVAVIDGKEVWLDSTQEVAPFGYLVFPIRNRQSLVLRDKASSLELSPSGGFPKNEWEFTSKGELSPLGVYKGHFTSVSKGTQALILRAAYRSVGQSKWQELAQELSKRQGFGGTVSNVEVAGMDDPEAPFQISYDYERTGYSDWENRRISPPFPPTGLAMRDDQRDPNEPLPSQILLGEPLYVVYRATMKLPDDAQSLPENADSSTDFASYSSRITVKDRVLTAERTIDIKSALLPHSRRAELFKFGRYVYDSEIKDIPLAGNSDRPIVASDNAESYTLFEQARRALMNRRFDVAETTARQILVKDPKFPGAHQLLAASYTSQGDQEKGIAEFKKEIEANPTRIESYNMFVAFLNTLERDKELREALTKCTENIPSNPDCWSELALVDVRSENYKQAAADMKESLDRQPNSPDIRLRYAQLLLKSGEKDKAFELMMKAVNEDATPDALNTTAYEMAEADHKVELAEEFATKAVAQIETPAASASLENISSSDLRRNTTLSAYWDTMGWIYFKEGKLDLAERYLLASWRLAPADVIGAHLGQVYAKQGKRQKAIETYRLASSIQDFSRRRTSRPSHVSADLLHKSTGTVATVSMSGIQSLQDLRTGKLAFSMPRPANGEFYFLFGKQGKLEAIKYINGSDEFKAPATLGRLKTVVFPTIVPPGNPDVKIIRRGSIVCPGRGSMCSAVLFQVQDVMVAIN